jgi:hypothetical protein
LITVLVLAGLVQLAIALGSLAIPRVLGWRNEVRRLEPLTRAVFWTYAGYIWATNVALGLVTLLVPEELLARSLLARCICGFAGLWWAARLVLQLGWFRRHAPRGWLYAAADSALVSAFFALSVVYALVALG